LPPADDESVFACDPSDPLPTIPVRVAGRALALHLDTGAPGTVLLPMHFATELPPAGPLEDGPPATTQAGTFAVRMAPVRGDVTIGRFAVDVGRILFSDLRPGPRAAPGNVGAAALQTLVVTYDSANCRVRLRRGDGSGTPLR
jgi:hypothetical protein